MHCAAKSGSDHLLYGWKAGRGMPLQTEGAEGHCSMLAGPYSRCTELCLDRGRDKRALKAEDVEYTAHTGIDHLTQQRRLVNVPCSGHLFQRLALIGRNAFK